MHCVLYTCTDSDELTCTGKLNKQCQVSKLYWCMQAISSLVEGDGSIVQVNDKKLASTLRLKLRFSDTVMHDANGTT